MILHSSFCTKQELTDTIKDNYREFPDLIDVRVQLKKFSAYSISPEVRATIKTLSKKAD